MVLWVVELTGWVGTILILLSYFLLTNKKLNETSKIYHGMNLLGGMFIVVNAAVNGAYPPAVLNIIWGIIAAYGIVKGLRPRLRNLPEEFRHPIAN